MARLAARRQAQVDRPRQAQVDRPRQAQVDRPRQAQVDHRLVQVDRPRSAHRRQVHPHSEHHHPHSEHRLHSEHRPRRGRLQARKHLARPPVRRLDSVVCHQPDHHQEFLPVRRWWAARQTNSRWIRRRQSLVEVPVSAQPARPRYPTPSSSAVHVEPTCQMRLAQAGRRLRSSVNRARPRVMAP